MGTLQLYATAVLIWGSTWFVLQFQLGEVPVAVSIVLVFACAWKRRQSTDRHAQMRMRMHMHASHRIVLQDEPSLIKVCNRDGSR